MPDAMTNEIAKRAAARGYLPNSGNSHATTRESASTDQFRGNQSTTKMAIERVEEKKKILREKGVVEQ